MPAAADDMARLVREQGRPLLLRVTLEPETYDPATGITTPARTRDDELAGMMLAGGTFEVRGTAVQGVAPRAVFAAGDVPAMPDTTSVVIDGETTYQVARVRTRTLDGAPVLVVCELAA